MRKKVGIIVGSAVILAAAGWFLHDVFVPMFSDSARSASLAAKAQAEFSAKNYAQAERHFEDAMNLAGKANRLTPELLTKYGDMQLEWALSPVMSQDERMGRVNKARNAYRRALELRPGDVYCQRRLADLAWMEAGAGGKWPAYIKEADALLAIDDGDAATYYRRGLANAEIGRSMRGVYARNAMADLRKALELKPSEAEYWIRYCQVLQSFEPAGVEQAFEDAVKSAGDKAAIHATYGDFLAAKHRDEDALRQYRQAIEVEPKNMMGYLALARFHDMRGQANLGMQALMEARAADPSDHRPYRELALMANRQGQTEQALAIIRDGIAAVKPRAATSPSSEESEQRRVEGAKAELYYLLVNTLLDWGQSHPSDGEKSLAEAKSYRDNIAPMGKALIERVEGRFALADGRLDDACRLLEASAADSPALDSQTAYLLVQAYLMKNEPMRAMPIADHFLKTQEADRNPLGHVLKAQILMRMGQLPQARQEIEAALKMQPANPSALSVKADLDAMSTSQPTSRP